MNRMLLTRTGIFCERLRIFSLILIMLVSPLALSAQITVSARNKSVKAVLDAIEKRSDYRFQYAGTLADLDRIVSVSVDNESIDSTLKRLFAGTNIVYTVNGNHVVLAESKLSDPASAGPRKIAGIVRDQRNVPVVGATVQIVGTNIGTITDAEGRFTLNAGAGQTLNISFIGYIPQNVVVGSQTNFEIALSEDRIAVDEVVVVGYGNTKRKDLTGSIASVKGDKVNVAASSSIEKLLQGRVAGLNIAQTNDNDPKGSVQVRIRGNSSINGSNAPLMVIDGVPMGDAGNSIMLNPDMVASVEVLKDASSTAIYGSRGANGVILVTTKTGTMDSPVFWVNMKMSVNTFSKELEYWRDPVKMAQLSNEEMVNSNLEPLYIGKKDKYGIYYPSVEEIASGAWPYRTNWPDYMYRTPLSQEYNVGVENRTKKGRYYVNLGMLNTKALQIENNYSKYTLDLKYEHKIHRNVTLSSNTMLFVDFRNTNEGLEHTRNPLWPVYNADGSYYKSYEFDYGNPAALTNERVDKSDYKSVAERLELEWKIIPELVFKASGYVKGDMGKTSQFNPPLYTSVGDQAGENLHGQAMIYDSNSDSFVGDSYLTYSKVFGGKHSFSAMIGVNYEYYRSRNSWSEGEGFVNQSLKDANINNAEKSYTGASESESKLASGFTRLNYSYDNRYFVTFTARADGASKFGKNNKWGYFPSGAVAWKLSEEKFMKDISWIDLLKIRASYGLSGNQGISPYQTFEQYGFDYFWENGVQYRISGVGTEVGREGSDSRYIIWGGMPNEDLGWEKTSQLDVGFDLALFGERLNVTFDYYYKRTTDLLRQKFLSPSTGYDRVWTNDGTITNKGIELTVNGTVVNTPSWTLNLGGTIAANRNKVVALGTGLDGGYRVDANGLKFEPYGGGNFAGESYFNILAIGYPMNVFYGYKANGILQDPYGVTPAGEINYEGLREDGTLDESKRQIIGDPNPDFTYSFSLDLTHKSGLDFSLLLYGVYGNDIFTASRLSNPSTMDRRWTPDNPSNTYPRLNYQRIWHSNSLFVEDGSYLRVKNIGVGYTLPSNIAPKVFKGLRISFNVTNPFTFTRATGYDPEVMENGIGGSYLPRYTTYTIGLNMKF